MPGEGRRQVNSGKLDVVIARIAGFFRWWGRELATILPERFRVALGNQSPPVLIHLCADTDIDSALGSVGPGRNVTLALDVSVVLTNEVSLPRAGRQATAGMANIQLARTMPLQLSELYTDWKTVAAEKDQGEQSEKQRLRLYAAKRTFLDPVFDRLSSRALILSGIVLDEGDQLPGLAPMSAMRPYQRDCLKRVGILVLLGIAVLMVPYAWLSNVRSENAKVTQEIAVLRPSIQGLSERRNQVESHHDRIDYLEKQRSGDWFFDTLALLSKESPDTVSLREFVYEPGRLRVSGSAKSAADWALSLGKLQGVNNVTLQQVSSGRTPEDPENFDIAIELANGASR